MGKLLDNSYVHILADYSIVILCTVVFLSIFELATSYRNWDEIKKGNVAVAMTTGGKIFGIANIFRFSIAHHDRFLHTIAQGGFGFFLLLAGYFIFEFLTPTIRIDEEIKKDNRAVGLIAMFISIGLSYVIGVGL